MARHSFRIVPVTLLLGAAFAAAQGVQPVRLPQRGVKFHVVQLPTSLAIATPSRSGPAVLRPRVGSLVPASWTLNTNGDAWEVFWRVANRGNEQTPPLRLHLACRLLNSPAGFLTTDLEAAMCGMRDQDFDVPRLKPGATSKEYRTLVNFTAGEPCSYPHVRVRASLFAAVPRVSHQPQAVHELAVDFCE